MKSTKQPIHKFTSAVNIDGERLNAILTVTEDNRGRYHYALNRHTGIAESISDISRSDLADGESVSAFGRGDARADSAGATDSISDISRDGPEGRRSASGRDYAHMQFIGENSDPDKVDSTTEHQARRLHDRTPSNQRAHRMFKLMGTQPIDRLFRMPLELFGGLNSHGEYRPGMYLQPKAKVLDAILF